MLKVTHAMFRLTIIVFHQSNANSIYHSEKCRKNIAISYKQNNINSKKNMAHAGFEPITTGFVVVYLKHTPPDDVNNKGENN